MGKKVSLFVAMAMAFTTASQAEMAAVSLKDLPKLQPEEQHVPATQRTTNLFIRSHYKAFDLDDRFANQVFDRYLEHLDYNKMSLLKSDVDNFAKFEKEFDDALRKGKLDFAYEIYNLSLKRRFQRFEYAISLLEKEMDFTVTDEFFFDREDATWAKDEKELDELWRQKVKYDALSLKMTGKDWKEIKKVLAKRYRYAMKRMSQTQSEDVFQTVMNAFARSIEAHTSYLSPRSADRFKMEMNLSLEGIGAVLQTDEDYTVIKSLVAGGPADKTQKLSPKDRIIGVAQDDEEFTDVIGWRLDDVVDLIKGPKGTTVRLQVLGDIDSGDDVPQVVDIVRDKIRLEDRAAKSEVIKPILNDLTSKIGVISIPGFYNNLSEDVKKEIDKLKAEKVDGIIIDLRMNGGGALTEARLLSGLFIDRGPVVQVKEQNGRIVVHPDNDGEVYYDGPLTVLVNRYSASASEIFAAAMQDYGRAVIIGEQTFGKGTVQQHKGLGKIFDFYEKPLGNVQYTIAKFYRIDGGSTQHKGVIPDIVYPSMVNASEWGESKEDNALPWDSIRNVKYTSVADLSSDIDMLRQKHSERVKKEPEFKYLLEDIKEYKEQDSELSISLKEADRKAKQEDNKKRRLTRANERLARMNKDSIKTMDDAPEVLEELDPLLEEAALITQDLIGMGRFVKK